MNRRTFLEYLPLGLVFGLSASKPANGQTFEELALRVQTSSENIRQQSTERINEDARQTGATLSNIVREVVSDLQPGMTTEQIDAAFSSQILSQGLLPSMLGFRGFPASSALSVSPNFLHSPPDEQVIVDGDLLTIQVSANSDFSHASLGLTVPIGCPAAANIHVLEGCRRALQNAISVVRAGVRTGEISHEIQRSLSADSLSPIRDFVGYGMGRERIQAPQILGYGPADRGDFIEAGMILNIHVIGTMGEPLTRIAPDNWTATTQDGSTAALATAMVLVEENGSTVITSMPEMSLTSCMS